MKLAIPTLSGGRGTLLIGLLSIPSLAVLGCDTGSDGNEESGGSTDSGPSDDDDGDTSAGEDSTGGDSEPGSESGPSDGSEEDTGPAPEGLGCDPAPACDKGELAAWTRIETEADIALVAGYTSTANNLEIYASQFECLNFLSCLETVNGNLTVFGNDLLVDFTGADNITKVTGTLSIAENNGTQDMNGFNGITQLGGLSLNSHAELLNITGFASLIVIQGDLTVRDNDKLEAIDGFSELKAVGGKFSVTNNPSLCVSEVNRIGAGLEQCGDEDNNDVCDGSTSANKDGC